MLNSLLSPRVTPHTCRPATWATGRQHVSGSAYTHRPWTYNSHPAPAHTDTKRNVTARTRVCHSSPPRIRASDVQQHHVSHVTRQATRENESTQGDELTRPLSL